MKLQEEQKEIMNETINTFGSIFCFWSPASASPLTFSSTLRHLNDGVDKPFSFNVAPKGTSEESLCLQGNKHYSSWKLNPTSNSIRNALVHMCIYKIVSDGQGSTPKRRRSVFNFWIDIYNQGYIQEYSDT